MQPIKSSWGLIITFACAVLIGGGTIFWYYYSVAPTMDVNFQSPISVKKKTAETATTTTSATVDWKTFKAVALDATFKYPKEWGTASSNDGKTSVETGYSYLIRFSNNSKIFAGYASTDFSAGREGYFYETAAYRDYISTVKDCATFKKTDEGKSNNFVSCKDIEANNKVIGILISDNFGTDEMLQGPYTIAYYFTQNKQYPVFGLEINSDDVQYKENFELIVKSFK